MRDLEFCHFEERLKVRHFEERERREILMMAVSERFLPTVEMTKMAGIQRSPCHFEERLKVRHFEERERREILMIAVSERFLPTVEMTKMAGIQRSPCHFEERLKVRHFEERSDEKSFLDIDMTQSIGLKVSMPDGQLPSGGTKHTDFCLADG
ncbi:MAG: hypothetical protein RBS58_04935 [Syntrophales bacterium]|nr:hypothetical protein [Syntrophales bacterium]MDX9921992.1 hypothetical protein [Syntrophales bacterium]